MKLSLRFGSNLAGLALAACLGTTGCKTTVNTVETAQPAGTRHMVSDKRIITDGSLRDKVRIIGVNDAPPPPGGLWKVQVELLNTTRRVQTFSYRWEWFDENGMQVSSPASTDVTRQIEGRESIFISAVAPKPGVRDFRLKLIENLR